MPNPSRRARLRRKKRAERRGDPSPLPDQAASRAAPLPPGWSVWQLGILPWLTLVFPLAFLALGWFWLSAGFGDRSLAIESWTWPTTPGVILTAKVVSSSAGRFQEKFEPRVTYSYTAAGASYTGNVIRPGGYDYGDRRSAESKLAEYPVGITVTVRYDPAKPGRSVLEPGGGERWGVVAGAGAAFGIAGVVLLVVTIRDAWRRLVFASAGRDRA